MSECSVAGTDDKDSNTTAEQLDGEAAFTKRERQEWLKLVKHADRNVRLLPQLAQPHFF